MTANVATMRPRVVNRIIARAMGFRPMGHGYWQRGEEGQPEYWRQRPGPPEYASNLNYCQEAVQELLTPEQRRSLYLWCLAQVLPRWDGPTPRDIDQWHSANTLLALVNARAVTRARALVMALDILREETP